MNLDSYKQYIRIKLVKEGLYNVYFADTSVFLGVFKYREVSNLYTYEPPDIVTGKQIGRAHGLNSSHRL